MSETILKNDGSPFETEHAANIRKGILKKDGIEAEVIAVEGGFALSVTSMPRKRVPLTKNNVLTVSGKDPNYVYRVVNDGPRYEDRIQRFIDAGWEFDTTDGTIGDDRVGNSKVPGSAKAKPVGHGLTGVVMRKKKEWFEEDYAKKQEINDKTEEGLIDVAAQGRYGKLKLNQKTFNGELK